MAKNKKRNVEDLAAEAAAVIESCDLRSEELVAFLAAFVRDCGVGTDAAHAKAHARLERALAEGEAR
jgi:hypothetical protein